VNGHRLEIGEFVPVVIDRVDRNCPPQQRSAQLKIVGGSAKIRSTDFAGSAFIRSMQSP